ncbi:MAG TPA: YdeI/OmpD-associated family protein [Thermoanaerobaculia bacterium]|nr:YdeI/OmpD-associated family protein [Thermoanaerobaculia bacterium]
MAKTIPETLQLHVTTREAWRAWLQEHHDRESEIWLVFDKKHTGRPRVSYDEAVEEALCFGWIDGLVRRLDEDRYMQRFSPRKPGSQWSALNLQRYAKLREEGRLAPAGLASAPPEDAASSLPRRWTTGDPVPDDIEQELRRHPAAWAAFERLPPSHRQNYLRWITEAKQDETRRKRLAEAVTMLSENRRLSISRRSP